MLFGIEFHTWWFCVIVLVIIGYTVLDGFDLGVGILHIFTKEDSERRVFMNAIGPVWDGNAVWLVIVVGGLFAGFPGAYATIMSSFYIPITVFIAGLILRAVAIEFRSKQESTAWRKLWDTVFFLASLVIALGAGLLLGNLIQGIPLDENHDFVGSLLHMLTPYALLVGVTAASCFTMHGVLFLVMKTEGALHKKVRSWVNPCIIIFFICYYLTTMATLIYQPHMVARLQDRPYLFIFALLSMLAIANIPRLVSKAKDGLAFFFSCISIASLLVLYGIGMYPVVMRSSINPAENSLTVFNSASSDPTYKILLIIVAIGIPLVLTYCFIVYRTFRGRVKIDRHSY
jgi:cytochrome d ubiquinol oxidase subunit II